MIDDRGLDTKISLDGRISQDNVRAFGKGIADQFVLGSTCLKRDNMRESIRGMMKLRDEVLGG